MRTKMPLHLRLLNIIFSLVSSRFIAISLSIILLISGYCIDSILGRPEFLSKFSGIVTALGLILTIKNNYLLHISSSSNLVQKENQESQFGDETQVTMQNAEYMKKLYSEATDEGLGLILIVIGTILSSFGEYIPFFAP